MSVSLVTFEIFSHYPKTESSYCLKEDVQWITDKFFREKLMVSNGFDLFFSHFSTEFWFSPVFVVVFSHKTCCDVLLMNYASQTSPFFY